MILDTSPPSGCLQGYALGAPIPGGVDADDVIELGYRLLVAVEAVADQLGGEKERNLDVLLEDLRQAAERLAPLIAQVETLPAPLGLPPR
jgi:hypothetical protein